MFSETNSIKIYLKTPRFELFLFELFYSTHDVYIFNYENFQL
jgi:hypothetical protein